MRVLVQRCSNAKCVVKDKLISEIDDGLMLLVGFTDSKIGINIVSIKTISRDEYATYEMEVAVNDLEHLTKLLLDLRNLPYITSVERLIM